MVEKSIMNEFTAFVDSCDYPCSKDELLDKADTEYVSDEVYELLESLPDLVYLSEAEVIENAQE